MAPETTDETGHTMTDDKASSAIELNDLKVTKLRDVAYSAGIESSGKKAELVERLEEHEVSFGPNGWTMAGDGFEVEERPTGANGPKTYLYGFLREATPDGFMEELSDWADDNGYDVETGETDDGKATVKITESPDDDE